jgi:hypothetical protein
MVQTLLALPDVPRPDHAADALAVAICHVHAQPPSTRAVGVQPARSRATSWRTYKPAAAGGSAPGALRPAAAPASLRRGKPARP